MTDYQRKINVDTLWQTVIEEARQIVDSSPLLESFYERNILQHQTFKSALTFILAEKLAEDSKQCTAWLSFLQKIMSDDSTIEAAALDDLLCQLQSNASIKDHYSPLLYFAGYQALQAHRFAHYCWLNDDKATANYIQSRIVSLYGVDIHPAAVIGRRIFIDHAVGIVIGETAVIEDEVTLFQSVTLGGTGKMSGDRHPKIRKGAFIGSGAVILGNIEIGQGAKIAAGSVVLKPVNPYETVVGVAAKPLSLN